VSADAPLRIATSPDGKFTLELYQEDDFYLGFRDQPWHTHCEGLVPEYGATPIEAAHAFFNAIVEDRELICTYPEGPFGVQVQVTYSRQWPVEGAIEGAVDVRLWSGRQR
jgi:hypothetical protein